jgi:hypothetical protein
LLKEWLVKYKFKSWDRHRTSSTKKGQDVTQVEKEESATEIAKLLGNNNMWHSHGRSIGIYTLVNILKLEIEDYSEDKNLKTLIRQYNDLISQYIIRTGAEFFLHSRKSI